MSAVIEQATAEIITHPAASTPNPAQLLAIAVQQGADLDRLERLMALQERWEATEARRAFVAAMAAFKAEPLVIFKQKKVSFTTRDGDTTSYSHAELSDVTDVVGQAMARHGLTYDWDIDQREGRVHVSCIVTHVRGHTKAVKMDAPPDASGKKNTIQQIASATTYLQRYTLLAAVGMSTKGMDDDGQGADNGAGEGAGQGNGAGTTDSGRTEQAAYPADRFETNLPQWRDAVREGKTTPDRLIAMLSTKGTLNATQTAKLRALGQQRAAH